MLVHLAVVRNVVGQVLREEVVDRRLELHGATGGCVSVIPQPKVGVRVGIRCGGEGGTVPSHSGGQADTVSVDFGSGGRIGVGIVAFVKPPQVDVLVPSETFVSHYSPLPIR